MLLSEATVRAIERAPQTTNENRLARDLLKLRAAMRKLARCGHELTRTELQAIIDTALATRRAGKKRGVK